MSELDDLARVVAAHLEAADAAAFRAYEDQPGWGTLATLLERARQIWAISSGGVRVDLMADGDHLRVLPGVSMATDGRRHLTVQIEDLGGVPIQTVEWFEDAHLQSLLASITVALQGQNRYPGDLRAKRLFTRLGTTLRIAIEIRRSGTEPDLSPIIEIPGDGQWAVTTSGVEALPSRSPGARPYRMLFSRVMDDSFYRHIVNKPWVVEADFEGAYLVARALAESRPDWLREELTEPTEEG